MNNKNKIALISALVMAQNVSANEMKNFEGIRFVKIEAGCFQMGQDKQTDLKEKDKQTTTNELPQHKVCIDKPFYMGESEVTQKQWEDVMGSNPSKFKGMYRPVEKVNWNDTQTFIEKLNDRFSYTGKKSHLVDTDPRNKQIGYRIDIQNPATD